MAVNAVVKDGQLVETVSQATASAAAKNNATASEKTGYDKDAFMQILVAQMKYQDPLEPTSNTEYISQYATFSQVEQLQNMATSMELNRASSYVGQTVQLSATDAKGEETIVEGVVDFIKYENGKAFLSVGGELYPAENVTAVIDPDYNTAYRLAETFAESINKLPALANLTLGDRETIETLRTGYNALSTYQQSFIDDSYLEKLKEYVAAMDRMVADSEASKKKAEEDAQKAAEDETQKIVSGSSEGGSSDDKDLSDEELEALLNDVDTE